MTTPAYSFLPWLRRGIATAITAVPATGTRAGVTVRLQVGGTAVADGSTLTRPVEHDVALYGPGDVVGVDPRAIVRTEPRDGITNFDPNYLPFVEFYDEDFPWRYSPDVADPATGRLRPWLALVVLTEDEFTEPGPVPGRPLPYVQIADLGALPPPDQLGAWAHVHVNRTVTASDAETVSQDMAAVLPRLAGVLAENPDLACARMLCPRRLDPQTAYQAFLVPAFEAGRLAGLGLDPAGAPGPLQSSWADYPGRPETASLCYYSRWRFATATLGDFEYLVRLLKPRTVDARVGFRDLDVRRPGAGLPGITDPQLGGVLRLGGALKVPDSALTEPEQTERDTYEQWDQPFPHPFQQALAALVDLGDDYAGQPAADAHQALNAVSDTFGTSGAVPPDDPDPLVTPPLYGRWHALVPRLLTERDGSPITPDDNWVHELNLDPRFRVAAGTGGRIVRDHDEEYMAAAWDQLGDVLAANRRIRAAQVAREVGYAHHAHHLEPLRQVAVGGALTLTAPLQSRVVTTVTGSLAGGVAGLSVPVVRRTVAASVADSVVATTPLSPAMRRITRPGSRLMRGLPFGPGTSGGGDGEDAGPHVAAEGDSRPARQQLLERMNSGAVTAAPPKTAPPAVVTVDALEEALAGPVITLRDAALVLDRPVPDPVGDLPTSADFLISRPGDGVHPTSGGADSDEAARFKKALSEAYAAFNVAVEAGAVPPRLPLDLDALAGATMDGVHPDRTVPRRALGGITLPGRLRPGSGGDGPQLAATPPADELAEVMAYPVIDLPMFRPLVDASTELFCPNVDLVPRDSITLLETNPRFIESYLVGLNHEMARELLWREYPTDQRGSVFRQFWDVRSVLSLPGETDDERRERLRDIPRIPDWAPESALGQHNNRGPSVEDLVLVIRGELLKKFPTAVIYAHRAVWKADGPGRTLAELTPAEQADPPPATVRMPLFDAKVEPEIYFFGFGLTEEEARGGTDPSQDAGWFFVIKERPGEPRFGLDIEREGALEVWNDLAWPDVLPAGDGPRYLRLDAGTPTLTLPSPGPTGEKAAQYAEDVALSWTGQLDAAQVAYILFQAPVLVAVHAREMLQDG